MAQVETRPTAAAQSPKPPAKQAITAKVDMQQRAVHGADGQSALLAMLKVEADARDAATERDLLFLIVNETRKLTRARQVFALLPNAIGGLEVKAVSSLASVDRTAPLIQFIEGLIDREQESGLGLELPRAINLSSAAESAGASNYPFRSLMWLPLRHGDRHAVGGVILAREDAWTESDNIIAKRLAGAFAHALAALKGPRRRIAINIAKVKSWSVAFAVALIGLLLFLQVPMSAIAPVEIAPRDPFVVAATLDGVIEAVAVEPNDPVQKGDLLVKLNDTTLRNRLEVAEREVQVAEAKLKQANQVAFSDATGLREIAIARSELALKLAERDFARDLLDKTEIRAARSGIAIYADKRDLIGRPVAVGERILEVADAGSVEARIELPVSDAITLAPGARVKLFLDSDPLTPWRARVRRADYKARAGENDVMAFRVLATIENDVAERPVPRLGVRGTAQVSGDDVPLALFLFRRPLTAMRQWLGV